jgi:hypothetical protein
MMLIGGSEPKSITIVRERIRRRDIAVANSTSLDISIDSGPFTAVTHAELSRSIAAIDIGVVRVRLRNASEKAAAPVIGAYELDFKVANATALRKVEQAFEKHLNNENPSLGSVDSFLADHRCQGAASRLP